MRCIQRGVTADRQVTLNALMFFVRLCADSRRDARAPNEHVCNQVKSAAIFGAFFGECPPASQADIP
jgi:hypothetical protein